MPVSETSKSTARGGELWPVSIHAYHTLGELGLIPKETELLYGQVYHRISAIKSLLLALFAVRGAS